MSWAALIASILAAIIKGVIDNASKPKTGVVAHDPGDLGARMDARLREYTSDRRARWRTLHPTKPYPGSGESVDGNPGG